MYGLTLMAVVLGVLVAALFGSADFLGGLASRATAVVTTVLASSSAGAAVALFATLVAGSRSVDPRDLLLGALVGWIYVIGLVCLYKGLAVGRASVVAPVSAVGASMIQVCWGIVRGDRPSSLAIAGIALALAAAALVSCGGAQPGRGRVPRRRELALALGAAAAFGSTLVLYSETASGSGFWPVLMSRISPIPVLVPLLAATSRSFRPGRADTPPAFAAGALDALANVLLLVAVRHVSIALFAAAAALYPAATVLLAWLFLKERLDRVRLIGLVMGLVGLALIAG
jgi:uncharacterized membrane protein